MAWSLHDFWLWLSTLEAPGVWGLEGRAVLSCIDWRAMRITGLAALLTYLAIVLVSTTPALFPQSHVQLQNDRESVRQMADLNARVMSNEQFIRDFNAMNIHARLTAMEQRTAEMYDQLSSLTRLTWGAVVSAAVWVLKEIIKLAKLRTATTDT